VTHNSRCNGGERRGEERKGEAREKFWSIPMNNLFVPFFKLLHIQVHINQTKSQLILLTGLFHFV
jgi:hypothetical protein